MKSAVVTEEMKTLARESIKKIAPEFEKLRIAERERDLKVFLESCVHDFHRQNVSLMKRYEWHDNGCPYDHSGEIWECGYIGLNETLDAFFEEYTGESSATYMSGMGLSYTTYGFDYDSFAEETTFDEGRKELSGELLLHGISGELADDVIDAVSDDLSDWLSDLDLDHLFTEMVLANFGGRTVGSFLSEETASRYETLYAAAASAK